MSIIGELSCVNWCLGNLANCFYFKNSLCRSCSFIDENGEVSAVLPVIPEELCSLAKVVNPWVRCSDPFTSRAKAKMSVSGTKDNPIIGILDFDLQGVELLSCPLHKSIINQALSVLPAIITSIGLDPYSIKERTGELKGIILQTNMLKDHLRVRFVVKSFDARDSIDLIALSLQKALGIKLSVSMNIQPIPHQIAEGPQEVHVFGDELLWESYETVKVAFPAQSFMQVTPHVASSLYQTAARVVSESKLETVLDLFSGAGGFSLSVAPFVKKVYGIEISKAAVEAARIAALKAGLENTEFIEADLLKSVEIFENIKPEVLICNPPRRGVGEVVLGAIKKTKPEMIIYSSCNPLTLVKDVLSLEGDYVLHEITPFEMFPLTKHFETLAVLLKNTNSM